MTKQTLHVTDEMQRLAKQLAERAAGYDRAQKTMGWMNMRHNVGLCSNSGYRNTVQQHETAVHRYKDISQPFYAAAKAANSELFSDAPDSAQQNLLAERTLKTMLNHFVAKIAAQEGLPSSNFYFYTVAAATR